MAPLEIFGCGFGCGCVWGGGGICGNFLLSFLSRLLVLSLKSNVINENINLSAAVENFLKLIYYVFTYIHYFLTFTKFSENKSDLLTILNSIN